MSYCRWSSDCHQCDAYVYEDVNGGFTTHIASRRRHPLRPVPPPPTETSVDATIQYWRHCSDWVKDETNWEWRDIVHEAAGRSFNDETARECADRLRKLKAEGVVIPQDAIDALEEPEGER